MSREGSATSSAAAPAAAASAASSSSASPLPRHGVISPAPAKRRPVFSLGAITRHLEQTTLSDSTARMTAPVDATSAQKAAASPAASISPSPSPSRSPHHAAAAAASPSSARSASSAGGAVSSSGAAAAPVPRWSPSPSPSPRAPNSAGAARRSPELASSGSDGSTSAPRKGLIIDREKQAAIDAQFGMSSSSSLTVSLEQVLEVYDLPDSATDASVKRALGPSVASVVAGAEAGSMLVVFKHERGVQETLQDSGRLRVRTMAQASDATRALASTLPAPQRPATDSRAANRLLAGALGIRLPKQSPEQREEEKRQRAERRARIDAERAAKEAGPATTAAGDAWE